MDLNSTLDNNLTLDEHYSTEFWYLFLALVIAEYVALVIKGESPRFAESLNSLGHGILSEYSKILTKGIEVSIYVSIYRQWGIVDLPKENYFLWILTFLAIDLGFYFAHRASHEINFLWALHQIHHSSEDFNIAIAVRHPISYSWTNFLFYLPLALFIPPQYFLVFQYFNVIYQAWLHTSLIGNLGMLEFILNTPTHHRLHHGCNLYVLDKNFGGFLIIWDRIFGTFESERSNEEIIFGIVHQHPSFNPIWQMWHKFPAIWNRSWSQASFSNSLKVIFFGPSWLPGAPRLGRATDKLKVRPRPKFQVVIPLWTQVYLGLHFLVVAGVFQCFAAKEESLSSAEVGLTLPFFVLTLTAIGLLSEGNLWAPLIELVRCLLCLIFAPASFQPYSILFVPSTLVWCWILVVQSFSRGSIRSN